MELDETDRRILAKLQRNCRATIAEVAEAAGLSPSPCLRRWKRLEEEGIIARYAAILDAQRLDLGVTVLVSVKLADHSEPTIAQFEAAMRRAPEVQECLLLSGQRDYQLRLTLKDLAAYNEFMQRVMNRIPGIAAIETSFAMREIKRDTALPL